MPLYLISRSTWSGPKLPSRCLNPFTRSWLKLAASSKLTRIFFIPNSTINFRATTTVFSAYFSPSFSLWKLTSNLSIKLWKACRSLALKDVLRIIELIIIVFFRLSTQRPVDPGVVILITTYSVFKLISIITDSETAIIIWLTSWPKQFRAKRYRSWYLLFRAAMTGSVILLVLL